MNHTILQKVQQAFHQAFGTDPAAVTIATQPEDVPQWDSLGHTNLAATMENVFAVSFTVDELMEMENVKAIVAILTRKLADKMAA